MKTQEHAQTPEQVEAEQVKDSALKAYYPKARKAMSNWPGLVSVAGERGYYPGCRALTFHEKPSYTEGLTEEEYAEWLKEWDTEVHDSGPAAQVNKFFEKYGNLTIVQLDVDDAGKWHMLVTTQLEKEELEDMQAAAEILDREMQKRRQEREEAMEEVKKQEREEAAENARLIALGKKAEEHNLLAKLKELAEQNEHLQKELKKLRKEKA